MAFGIFGKKRSEETQAESAAAGAGSAAAPSTGETGNGSSGDGAASDPQKAVRFFEHAQTVHDSTNYEYAMTLYLKGLHYDPGNVAALEKFINSSLAWVSQNPKVKGPTKEQVRQVSARGTTEKYLTNLLEWGARGLDWHAGLKAMEAAAKLELNEAAYWIGQRVFLRMNQDPKARKDAYVTLMELFAKIGGWDLAVKAGDKAVSMDFTDQKLAAIVRNMSAQATMSKGGYEKTGTVGGFRANVRDMAAQRAKEEEDRIVKSEETLDRVIERALADYQSRPTDVAAIGKIARLLLERGTPADEKQAFDILMKGFDDTRVYRFKQQAGDIKLRVAKRKLGSLKEAADQDPGNAEKADLYERARKQYLEMDVEEHIERVAHYPTDLSMKFELGRRLFDLGRYEQAIEQFQIAQNAPGLSGAVQNYLGRAFLAIGWVDEAVDTFRAALNNHPSQGDDLGQNLRYGLMIALERKATEQRLLPAAEEALKHAQAIAIQNIAFKDVRQRRESLQALVKSLRESQA